MEGSKKRVVLFLGAGFSVPSGYPCTAQLNQNLLETPIDSHDIPVEQFITAVIGKFWENVFAWTPGNKEPSLEDHFTQIDMAVGSGHSLGRHYESTKLRAVERITLHRVLSLLRRPKASFPHASFPHDAVSKFLRRLTQMFEVTIITTNWDTHVEWIFDGWSPPIPFDYGVKEMAPGGRPIERRGDASLLKLHGCVNMSYCDCCREWTRLDYGSPQAVVELGLSLDPEDFRLLGADAELIARSRSRTHPALSTCGACGSRLGSHVLTFTYRKELERFHAVWDAAKTALQLADRWLFVGYSMPESDVEVRHLVKSTQLARRDPAMPRIDVVLKEDCDAGQRYQRFLGLPCDVVFQDGVEGWVTRRLDDYCR